MLGESDEASLRTAWGSNKRSDFSSETELVETELAHHHVLVRHRLWVVSVLKVADVIEASFDLRHERISADQRLFRLVSSKVPELENSQHWG